MQVYEYKQIRDKYNYLCEKEFAYLSVDKDKKRVCKVFEPEFLECMLDAGYDLEDLVLNGTELVESSDIVVPESIVYSYGSFSGYLMPYFDGVCLRSYFNKNHLSFSEIADIYKKLEKIIKDSDNIVFPDLLTSGNILINKNRDIKLIDFDGLQVDYFATPVFNRYMGDKLIYNDTKYKDGDYFTKQLDIKSLIYLYIEMLLDIKLDFIDFYSDSSIQKKILDKFIRSYVMECNDLVHCITALYDNDEENVYLGDVVDVISNNYCSQLETVDGRVVKKLVRK